MSVKIVRDVNGTAVEVVKLDAVISHQIEMSASLTEHAIEDGSTIADHAIRDPDQIQITGWVTSFPVTILTGGIIPIRNFGRAKTAYQALKQLLDTPERVTIQDKLEQFTSMVLVNLRIPRDRPTFNGLQFTATFRKARIVSTLEIEISENDPIAKPAADVGVVTPEETTPEESTRVRSWGVQIKRYIESLAQ